MNKRLMVFCALLMAVPAICFAGSATSRWDMTIGGYVKFDMGWGSQSQGVDAAFALPSGNGPYDSAGDRYGNFFTAANETRINFLSKGPGAWGAKTSAFVEGDFKGAQSGSGSGTFALRQAFMAFDWPQTRLVIGQTWQKWGFLPSFGGVLLGFNNLLPFLKGQRQPMIRFEQNLTRNWNWSVAVESPTNTLGSNPNTGNTGVVDGFTLSQKPFFEGSFGWTSERCGNIGPWKLLFNLEGFYGQQKNVQQYNLTSGGVLRATTFNSKNVDSYGIAFKGFIPVIPERKGNKTGALSVSGIVFYTQNPAWFQPAGGINSYARPSDTPATPVNVSNTITEYAAPVSWGGWGSFSYYLTDQLYLSGWYGYLRNNISQTYCSVNTRAIQNHSEYILNLSYDVNQAIRLGIEGTYFNTRYGGSPVIIAGIPTTQKDGSYYQFRIGATYFF